MTATGLRFEDFILDIDDRRLLRGGAPVELNARYLDALALLAREAGALISKNRFMAEVWRGVPVTDEALTQCIRTLRRQLGDDAARPRFIETVPKHGYRFIAPVVEAETVRTVAAAPSDDGWRQVLLTGAAGTIGAGLAGAIGGVCYGFAGAAQPPQPGVGAASVLVVMLCLTILVALIGGAGVAFGIALAGRSDEPHWVVAGGAAGGLVVGAVTKLLGLDAFNLLFGLSPGNITGATEGLALGAAVGLGAWLAQRFGGGSLRRGAGLAALAGGLAGLAIPLLGGRLMGGSLALLAHQFPQSRLRLDQIGGLLGEPGFGPVSQAVTGALEGALFGGCVVGAMIAARRSTSPATSGVAPARP